MARQSGGIEFASIPSSIVNSACDVSSYSRYRGFRPDICHLSSTNALLGSSFLHMKARKLWQNIA